jgi:hypothetical protein
MEERHVSWTNLSQGWKDVGALKCCVASLKVLFET